MSEFPVITRYEVQGCEDVIRANAELWSSFKQGGISVKDFSESIKQNMEGTKAMTSAYRGIRSAIRDDMAGFIETSRVLTDVGRIGRDVLQMWQAYNIAMMRIESATQAVITAQKNLSKAQGNVADAGKDVAEWQGIYNQYLHDFGADSAYTKNAYEKLTEAQGNLSDAQSDAADALKNLTDAQNAVVNAQNQMYLGFVSMGLEVVGMAGSIMQLIVQLRILNALMLETQATGGLFGGVVAEFGGTAGLAAAGSVLGGATAGAIAFNWAKEAGLLPTLPIDITQATPLSPFAQGSTIQKIMQFPHGQLGIDYIPANMLIYAHKGERLLNPEQTRRERIGGARLITAKVTQNNTINNMADAKRAAEVAYQQFLKKLGDKS